MSAISMWLLAGVLIVTTKAHGDPEVHHAESGPEVQAGHAEPESPTSYWFLKDHEALIYGHITLMVIGWMIILPIGTMLSLARYRHKSLAQLSFLVSNAVGLLFGAMYNSSTPDLFPNNAHHKLGWVIAWIAIAHLISEEAHNVRRLLKGFFASKNHSSERPEFLPLSSDSLEDHGIATSIFRNEVEPSSDNCGGTENYPEHLASRPRNSGTSSPARSQSADLVSRYDEPPCTWMNDCPTALAQHKSWASKVGHICKSLLDLKWKPLLCINTVINRTLLILGFTALCTGIITLGRLFEGENMLNGLAHWIKGGVFVWFGIFTLGRWSGAFGDIGWAWNIRPRNAKTGCRPSAEFVESTLIFLYGATNIFLEHLSNRDGRWEARDLEHVSITVLFIGGGLCGMLVESSTIRELLNTNSSDAAEPDALYVDGTEENVETPYTSTKSRVPLNPMPALVILLLGIMMTSHAQDSMVSTMVHKQWGTLLSGSSIARVMTYMMLYMKPPRSALPSRPPTELLTSFGLISGGILLMASSTDTVDGMIYHELDPMVLFTINMGFVGLLMAWVLALLALKGWAIRRETKWQARY